MVSTQEQVKKSVTHIIDPKTSPAWADLISRTPANVFHSPEWMKVVEEVFETEISGCIIERDGRPVAGLAWSDVHNFTGDRRISLPFSDFCDPLASTPEDARALAHVAMRPGYPWTLRALARNIPTTPYPVADTTPFTWHGIDLTPDPEVMWSKINSRSKRAVKQAEKLGVEIRLAHTKAELREWFLLHMKLRRDKYALLAQPYSFFERIWDAFIDTDNGHLLVAVADNKIIAGTMYITWKNTCYYKFAASNTDYLQLRPNNLLMWRGMQYAKEIGCNLLDLGRSKASQDGLVEYKRSFGADQEDLYSITYGGSEPATQFEAQAKDLLRGMTSLFVAEGVPQEVTEEAGAALYKYFA